MPHKIIHIDGALRTAKLASHYNIHINIRKNKIIIDNTNLKTDIDNNHETDNNMLNRPLLVGPSFCGKTHLLLNKLQIIRLDSPLRQIRIITRSPEQYNGLK